MEVLKSFSNEILVLLASGLLTVGQMYRTSTGEVRVKL